MNYTDSSSSSQHLISVRCLWSAAGREANTDAVVPKWPSKPGYDALQSDRTLEVWSKILFLAFQACPSPFPTHTLGSRNFRSQRLTALRAGLAHVRAAGCPGRGWGLGQADLGRRPVPSLGGGSSAPPSSSGRGLGGGTQSGLERKTQCACALLTVLVIVRGP